MELPHPYPRDLGKFYSHSFSYIKVTNLRKLNISANLGIKGWEILGPAFNQGKEEFCIHMEF